MRIIVVTCHLEALVHNNVWQQGAGHTLVVLLVKQPPDLLDGLLPPRRPGHLILLGQHHRPLLLPLGSDHKNNVKQMSTLHTN